MRVRIYRPSKSSTQSGRARTQDWLVEPELEAPRTPDPIMGWAHASDTLNELRNRLKFPTLDDALSFARRKGWDSVVEVPNERRVRPRNYLDNFRFIPSRP